MVPAHSSPPSSPTSTCGTTGVVEDFDDILRFWFDRGVDGIRIDAAPAFAKADGLPDADYGGRRRSSSRPVGGQPALGRRRRAHEILRRWRRVGDEYAGDRLFVAEAVVNGAERLARYLRPDEMHSAFNFQFLKAPWDAGLR